ncbi:hypothetical protein K7X08_030066 [Anisodus acutangulus]|uniref:Uncharacterized protein n=1 Tax=Anisodus acutangulus TaxID=402998 RepID=A0A9Q1LLZ8_9SOLA|nr:hypothetical protein K7X08_030066 [Anisodus acutangulus]
MAWAFEVIPHLQNQKMDDLIKKVEEWTQVQKDTNLLLQKFISKRGVNPSKKLTSPYTPIGIRKRAKTISKVLANCRARKFATPQKSIVTPIAEVGPIVLKSRYFQACKCPMKEKA